MVKQVVVRLGMSCVLFVALPAAADGVVHYFEVPHIFGGVAAIASCVGACLPVLGLFKNAD